jgi:hypothetical protein
MSGSSASFFLESVGERAWPPPLLSRAVERVGHELSTNGNPAQFVTGRVRGDVAALELTFADGERVRTSPTRGFVLYAVPRAHLAKGHELIAATARGADGKILGSESFRPRRS